LGISFHIPSSFFTNPQSQLSTGSHFNGLLSYEKKKKKKKRGKKNFYIFLKESKKNKYF